MADTFELEDWLQALPPGCMVAATTARVRRSKRWHVLLRGNGETLLSGDTFATEQEASQHLYETLAAYAERLNFTVERVQ